MSGKGDVTPWFPVSMPPTRPGVYEVAKPAFGDTYMVDGKRTWNGERWTKGDMWSACVWRGLTKSEHDRRAALSRASGSEGDHG